MEYVMVSLSVVTLSSVIIVSAALIYREKKGIVVTRAFFDSAVEVSRLMTDSASRAAKKDKLPSALHKLGSEVLKAHRLNVK